MENTQWLDGFVKFAVDCGITDPQTIVALLKTHQTLKVASEHPAEFRKGAAAVLEKQGVSLSTVLALLAGGAGMHALSQGFKGWKRNVGEEYVGRKNTGIDRALADIAMQRSRMAGISAMLNPDKKPAFGGGPAMYYTGWGAMPVGFTPGTVS